MTAKTENEDTVRQNEIRGKILHWLANGETGLSPETIAFATASVSSKKHRHPRDIYDFNRCNKLRKEVPETWEGVL